ncbi:MAG: PIN domain-containing protein [Gammaproteobacteria bacterium]
MHVLVDTSVWSLVLRRQNVVIELEHYKQALTNLILNSKAAIIGAIRQELLSGIKSPSQFNRLKSYLQAFPDLILDTKDFEFAAELFNHCRSKGVQGSHIDFLITAVAITREMTVFTLDQDFQSYAKHTALKLYTPYF